ncbi:unnamed protein product [Phytomonas sp. Hart1]|nr:unnamed protein product [Phytomonas sp. Hart1]|eukprot:CCW68767.1 unnamed protein product [Phytomonas sp. isolate Hart1]
MGSKAEYIRYDRQIRLWGKTTQQRLMETEVRMLDLQGVNAEIAKNIVLAGIKSLKVYNTTQKIRAAELHNNLLVQRSNESMTCEEAGVETLKLLNPYVHITLSNSDKGGTEGLAGGHGISIALVRDVIELSSVVAQCGDFSDVVVLSVQCNSCILTFFLYRDEMMTMEQQWRRLVEDTTCIQNKPAAYQKMLLALYLGKSSPTYVQLLTSAMEAVEQLQLGKMSADEMEEVLTMKGRDPGPTTCTLAGASVAQHLIRHVGERGGERSWRWMICRGASEVEVGLD